MIHSSAPLQHLGDLCVSGKCESKDNNTACIHLHTTVSQGHMHSANPSHLTLIQHAANTVLACSQSRSLYLKAFCALKNPCHYTAVFNMFMGKPICYVVFVNECPQTTPFSILCFSLTSLIDRRGFIQSDAPQLAPPTNGITMYGATQSQQSHMVRH